MNKCNRKLTHICNWNSKNILIIVSHDYSSYSVLSTLSSAINDVSSIWNYFKRYKCLNDNQIFIYGKMNIDGKYISWKKRYNESFPRLSDRNIKYLYYSGHGFPGGRIDIPKSVRSIIYDILILDACYSHENKDIIYNKAMLASTCERKSLATSNHLISKFTSELIKYITNINNNDNNHIQDFKKWIIDNNYYLSIKDFDDIYETFLKTKT